MAEQQGNGKRGPIDAALRKAVRQRCLHREDYRHPSFAQLPEFIRLLEMIDFPIDDSKQGIELTKGERDQIATDLDDFRHNIVSGMRGVSGLLAQMETDDLKEADVHAVEAATRLVGQLAELNRYLGQHLEMLEASEPLLEDEEEVAA